MQIAVPVPSDVVVDPEPEDARMAVLAGTGNAAALEQLFSRYGSACYRVALHVLGSPADAEDAVQEVFLAVWHARTRFDATRGRVETWLLTLTHHKAVDAVRREASQSRSRAQAGLLDPTAAVDPALEVALIERQQRVRRALAQLPELQRTAVVLAYYGGYTQQEISGLTETAVGTVKSRMFAATHRLRSDLADQAMGAEEQDPS